MPLKIRVILVEPLYQGNVGSVARAMKNLGYSDLVLVDPCKLDGEACALASHARDLLENARIVDSIQDAIEGVNLVVGTTGMTCSKGDEHIRMPVHTSRQLKDKLNGCSGTIAILFGREDNGFTNDELKQCDMLVTIPTSEEYPIMNLSHAVTIVLYELSDVVPGDIPLGEHFDLELLYEHLAEILNDISYPEHKKNKTHLMFKRIFGRAMLTPREIQTLRGVLTRTQRTIR
ncbi:MAG: RNA methyltransferase [Methanosarcinaceae archaeon]|nr:RNA methyltransferase [Methanosarcinaceae archaeon]